jgi:hypothetical protein
MVDSSHHLSKEVVLPVLEEVHPVTVQQEDQLVL